MSTFLPPVVRATPADRDTVAEILAAGFADDPVFSWLLPARGRPARLRLLFGAAVEYGISLGHTYVTVDRTAVAVWSPPHTWRLPTATQLRTAPRVVQAARLRLPRVLRRLAELERHHARQPQEHWYLEFLATVPSAQGRGIGSLLLADGIERYDAAIYLDSPNPRTIPFYERAGFTVTEELRFRSGPPQWAFWRPR